MFSSAEIKRIYGNIEIVRSINIRLLDGIIKKLRSWGDTATIGDVFLQMVRRLIFYRLREGREENYAQDRYNGRNRGKARKRAMERERERERERGRERED